MLKLQKPKTEKQVQWEEGVVDNEFLGKKNSKCEYLVRCWGDSLICRSG